MSRPPLTVRLGLVAAAIALAACVTDPPPSATPSLPPATPTPSVEPSPPTVTPPTETDEPSPTATPVPELSLALPDQVDARRVMVSIAVDLPPDGDGTILATVLSGTDTMIEELVLRWPVELHDTLFPAPFVPSDDRIRDGGPPLDQAWTKWVVGPGERGEPEGTISLGYGPLLAGATLEIPLYVTRNAPGPVGFDLQVLAGEAILTVDSGEPAVLRVEVP